MIAAGGTAGHVVPAIAVADALRAEGAEVSFVGGERAEAELVPKAGYELDPLNVEGISRTNPLKAARALGKAGAAVAPARKILEAARRRRRARRRRVRGRPGRPRGGADQDAARADRGRLATSASPTARSRAARAASASPSRSRAATASATGSPAARCRPRSPTAPRPARSSGIGADETCVLVFGGSLGARSINHAAPEAFADAPYRVVHVAGTRDYPDLTAPGAHYVLLDYLTPFGIALAAADAAVARSGGSIFELAQYGLPSVLIPYPHASRRPPDAPTRSWMADAGAARILPDAELTPQRLREDTDAVLARPRADVAAALALAKPGRGARHRTRDPRRGYRRKSSPLGVRNESVRKLGESCHSSNPSPRDRKNFPPHDHPHLSRWPCHRRRRRHRRLRFGQRHLAGRGRQAAEAVGQELQQKAQKTAEDIQSGKVDAEEAAKDLQNDANELTNDALDAAKDSNIPDDVKKQLEDAQEQLNAAGGGA